MCKELENSAKAERKLAYMYALLSSAHRMRAVGLEQDDSHYLDMAEAYFDRAEEAGRDAFQISAACHVARYIVDGKQYKTALLELLDKSVSGASAAVTTQDIAEAIRKADDGAYEV